MEVKVFFCGLCKKEKRRAMTRHGLRHHLTEEHGIKNEKFNGEDVSGKLRKQKWVIIKDFDDVVKERKR